MATYDDMSSSERQKLMGILRSPRRLPRGPRQALPNGGHYEYDFSLKRTVEVTPLGQRFPVVLVDGKLQRDSAKTDRRKGEAD